MTTDLIRPVKTPIIDADAMDRALARTEEVLHAIRETRLAERACGRRR